MLSQDGKVAGMAPAPPGGKADGPAGSGCDIRIKVRKQGTSSRSEALAEVIQEHNRCVHRA